MRHHGILCAASLALALALPAQQTSPFAIVPEPFAVAEAPGAEFWALAPFDSRRQLLLGSSHLLSLVAANLRAIVLRRNQGDSDTYSGGRLRVELWLSHSPATPATMSATFAANRGPDHAKLLDAWITLPTAPPAPCAPAPWTPPYAVTLPLQAPFVYAGGSLCIETVTTLDPTTDPWWVVDAVVETASGSVVAVGSSCIPGMGAQPAGADAWSLTPGSTAAFWLRGPRASGSGFCALGTSSTAWGSLLLPFDLAALGWPGCSVYNDVAFALPATVLPLPGSGGGVATCLVPIPVQPGLAGAALFAQWALVGSGSNRPAATFSNGVQTILGSVRQQWDAGWLESPNANAASGALMTGRVPVLRIEG